MEGPPATPRRFNDEIVMIMASWLVRTFESVYVLMTVRIRSVTLYYMAALDGPAGHGPGARNGRFQVHRGGGNAMVCEN
jgi:hypothetical protein